MNTQEEGISKQFENIINNEYNSITKNDELDLSSFDHLPPFFCGLDTSTFGKSSNNQENPFFKIKEIALNSNNSWEDRTQALRYMQVIPHIEKNIHCIETVISILSDDIYPFTQRFHFISNNEKYIK